MKYIKRIIVSPFVFGILIITHWTFAIKRTWHFIQFGGEFIQYPKDEHKTIQSVYELVKEEQIKKAKL